MRVPVTVTPVPEVIDKLLPELIVSVPDVVNVFGDDVGFSETKVFPSIIIVATVSVGTLIMFLVPTLLNCRISVTSGVVLFGFQLVETCQSPSFAPIQ